MKRDPSGGITIVDPAFTIHVRPMTTHDVVHVTKHGPWTPSQFRRFVRMCKELQKQHDRPAYSQVSNLDLSLSRRMEKALGLAHDQVRRVLVFDPQSQAYEACWRYRWN